jgi:hypothetical protein
VERGKKDSYQSMSGTGKVKRRVLRHRVYSEVKLWLRNYKSVPIFFFLQYFFIPFYSIFFLK